MTKILKLPQTGKVLVASDLHGNYDDFEKMVSIFMKQILIEQTFLLFLGDLVHGLNYTEKSWPSCFEKYYPDQSIEILKKYIKLQQQYPNQICSLIGNHEHSHIGGIDLGKCCTTLEQNAKKNSINLKKLFSTFPYLATSSCGIIFMHGSPNLNESVKLEDIISEKEKSLEVSSISKLIDSSLLGKILWSRYADNDMVDGFLEINSTKERYSLVVSGHEIIKNGFEKISRNQLILSTSFSTPTRNKTYLELDLNRCYRSTASIREGHELKKLFS